MSPIPPSAGAALLEAAAQREREWRDFGSALLGQGRCLTTGPKTPIPSVIIEQVEPQEALRPEAAEGELLVVRQHRTAQ